MNLELRAFAGGSCRHLLAMIDRRTWRVVDFPALFLALRHPREGWILVDTGYGDRFVAATQSFPQRFYRWVTPATPAGTTSALLAAAGIPPAEIRHVIVTHFHADHVGGIAELLQKFRVPVYGPRGEPIPTLTHPVSEGDVVSIPGLGVSFSVLDIPGHTRAHIA